MQVLLIGEHEQWGVLEGVVAHQGSELLDALSEPLLVRGVDDEDEAIGVVVVVGPVLSDCLLASDVPAVQFEVVLLLNKNAPVSTRSWKISSASKGLYITYNCFDVETLCGLNLGDVFG